MGGFLLRKGRPALQGARTANGKGQGSDVRYLCLEGVHTGVGQNPDPRGFRQAGSGVRPVGSEVEKMQIVANRRAEASSPRLVEDVR